MALTAIDNLCEQHQSFQNLAKKQLFYKSVCKRHDLQIKCLQDECEYRTKKKKLFQAWPKKK